MPKTLFLKQKDGSVLAISVIQTATDIGDLPCIADDGYVGHARPYPEMAYLGLRDLLERCFAVTEVLSLQGVKALERKRELAFKEIPLTPDEHDELQELVVATANLDMLEIIEDSCYVLYMREFYAHEDFLDLQRAVDRKVQAQLLREHGAKSANRLRERIRVAARFEEN